MRLPVFVSPKASELPLTQVSIKPNAQAVCAASLPLDKERPPLGATDTVAEKPKTAVVIGTSAPSVTTDVLQSSNKKQPVTTLGAKEPANEQVCSKEAVEDSSQDEFDSQEEEEEKEERSSAETSTGEKKRP